MADEATARIANDAGDLGALPTLRSLFNTIYRKLQKDAPRPGQPWSARFDLAKRLVGFKDPIEAFRWSCSREVSLRLFPSFNSC